MLHSDTDIQSMIVTVQLSLSHVKSGGAPFSSLIASRNGEVLGCGVNEVNHRCDPTAHAEVMAIRQACERLGTPDLSGNILFASGEPCGLCYMAARWAGITDIIIAVDRDEAADAGFDYRWTYDFFKDGQPSAGMRIQKLAVEDSFEPFNVFGKMRGKFNENAN